MSMLDYPKSKREMGSIPEVILSSGHRMQSSYRHFDTAALYRTEKPIGEAVAEALRLGLFKSRDELFIATKLWINDGHPDCILPSLHFSLQNLHMDCVDLYLIHWPVSISPGEIRFPEPKEKYLIPVWVAMEDCQRQGLTKSVGVSNFTCKMLDLLLDLATIPPAVNQVQFEYHVVIEFVVCS